ncbi:aminofutalosine synthase MqnE [Actinoplanes sp. NPDC051411]|uniref:aminofutalosine synthase MqnE n=1 Tax=Actinoplanes sp. NPDC051411 TaxID=3155522 RepID=UPI0034454C47
MDAGLKRELEAKVYAGERLTREDGIALFESDDLAWLGRLAHHQRTEINGDRVTFAANRHLGLDQAVSRAAELAGEQVTELHIVNGMLADLSWRDHLEALGALTAALPGVSLRGFTVADVQRFEEISGRPAGEVLDELMAAGLESLTGDESAGDDGRWERIHRLAHERGMKTPATMLYGHAEEAGDRVDRVVRFRELQDETGGFAVFIPLRHQPGSADAGTTPAPAESLKTFAVSRLLFDNVAHVQSSWGTHGSAVTQLSLNFGADDLDTPDDIAHDDRLTLIWDAGFRPIERNSTYAVVREYDTAPSFADRRSEPQQVWA